ncbi:OmpA family protein [Pontibacter vulgaris]|uniref:OmpA family protein n=1 Tax=Pontibacter vulgaris TaxID=2905679 RepID=UPI001FA6C595|nr:OmpA family protein [Pontibacter vulgaris]
MKNAKTFIAYFLVAVFLLGSVAASAQTTTKKPVSRTVKGGVIGAVVGGVAGGFIGKKKKNTAAGAIIGAAVGGAAGAVIGRYMDKQAEELQRELANAKVERVGEGIKITFDSGILFETNSDQVSYAAQSNIADLSKTLNKYKDTNVMVEGHTDARGNAAYNQSLSERRASSVYQQITSNGVASTRITTQGFGESMPIASNATTSGMQQNRRVEVAIFANEKLKKAAEKGQI